MKFVGARLREERKTLNLTQHEFAALGGVESNAQAHYESGSRQPRASYLIGVAGKGVDILYVLLGVRTPLGESSLLPSEAAVIKHYRSLHKDDRGAISQLSKSLSQLPELQTLSPSSSPTQTSPVTLELTACSDSTDSIQSAT